MTIGSIKQQLVSAKLPNPDLTTALEVLIKGRPQLPTYDFIPAKPLNPALVLNTLKNLNVELSTRMALQEGLPPEFYNYTVKDGRVTFHVPNSFQCSISIADDSPDSNFFLVDFKLGFQSKDVRLIPKVTSLPRQTFHHLEKFANRELSKQNQQQQLQQPQPTASTDNNNNNSNNGSATVVTGSGENCLFSLFKLLHNYSTTCKLYQLHRHLIQLRMGIWKGHITHTYNAEKCFVVITYWLKRRAVKSTIEIGKFKDNELDFRWIKEGLLKHGQAMHDWNELTIDSGFKSFENSAIQH
ncbi:unnamed protein product [Ambrosiozyma monospora]|uniref:Unnamed protein product n=1 Tax=Ambrosiozyma monospora TaxID=43982 RepID=A0ACB5U2D4_AMBMO|nr:unnamed protein product [Ambrosiozyma monospora]